MDRGTGAIGVRQRFLNALPQPSFQNGEIQSWPAPGSMLDSFAVPGFRVLLLSHAGARQRHVARFHRPPACRFP